jgi:hypothetical protein
MIAAELSEKERIRRNHISRLVVTAAMKVHSLLGAGLPSISGFSSISKSRT